MVLQSETGNVLLSTNINRGNLDQRHNDANTNGGDMMEISIGVEKPVTRRRSNSKVYNGGSTSQRQISGNSTRNRPVAPADISNTSSPSSFTNGSSSPTKKLAREQFVHLLILVSLNETFDRRALKIPTFPDAIKLGRPNNSQKTPNKDNGYFDSKVISREHAELYVKENKLYIKDLDSSNGTFLNGIQIQEECELNVGDTIDLGIDIDTEKNKHQHHRKISCRVDNILTVPLDGAADTAKFLSKIAKNLKKEKQHQEMNPFDSALFGDVTSDLDDLALGMNHNFLSGIFVNNNIGTSSNLTESVKILINQLHLEKLNSLKLESIENFLNRYSDALSKDEHVIRLNSLKQELKEKENRITKINGTIEDLTQKLDGLNQEIEKNRESLKEKDTRITELKTSLEEKNRDLYDKVSHQISSLQKRVGDKKTKIQRLEKEKFEIEFQYQKTIKDLEYKNEEKSNEYNDLKRTYTGLVSASINLDEFAEDVCQFLIVLLISSLAGAALLLLIL